MNKRGIPEKRVAYLETCFNVFCENGLENTGLKMLADACGVSNANLLYYFGDKELAGFPTQIFSIILATKTAS